MSQDQNKEQDYLHNTLVSDRSLIGHESSDTANGTVSYLGTCLSKTLVKISRDDIRTKESGALVECLCELTATLKTLQ